jgi:hypothetical protein
MTVGIIIRIDIGIVFDVGVVFDVGIGGGFVATAGVGGVG